MKNILIIGGGISGLCSAYYLVKEGHRVTVIDKNDLSSGASFINAGFVTPSHFMSLAAPGVVSKGLKWMWNSSSPLYVKPRLDWDFLKWAFHFNRSATLEKVEKAVPVLKGIGLKSRGLFEEMHSSLDFKFHYENEGLLMAYTTAKSEDEESELAERVIEEGLEARKITREELKTLQPAFSEKVRGAIQYKCDSHTTPTTFMRSMKKWLEENGVQFKLHHEVTQINISNNKIVAVEASNTSFEADEFVLAAGSWTSSLAKSVGLKIPIQGGKGYSIDIHRATGISMPAVLAEAKVAVTPMDGFVRFAGTMEFSGNNSVIRTNRVEAIANWVEKYYPSIQISEEEKKGAQSGLRPVSPDGLPFIGKPSRYQNLTIAAGHAMLGWSLGPATGKLVSQIIDAKNPLLDLAPFSPDRFG